ncbi:hypothetical protein MKX01_039270 [Papaver californicum]|nr:hypothetical protein MKX01_039270 [Papaver californicum]
MVYLPWNIQLDILVRLPFKSIARFRCVNHSWHSELKSTKFLRDQLRLPNEMGKFNLMLNSGNEIEIIRVDPSSSSWEGYSYIQYLESLESRIRVFGCCYGLVLLRLVRESNDCFLMIWNPTTNEYKILPKPLPGTKDVDREYDEYALGYSSGIKDFKVVYLTESLKEGWCEVQVYTLKTNSWRRNDNVRIDGFISHGMSDTVRRPVGGAAHWLAFVDASYEGYFVVSFDIETEEFYSFPLPPSYTYDEKVLGYLGGSVCFFYDTPKVLTVWKLKKNVPGEPWTKLFTVKPTQQFGAVESFMPLKSLRNGEIVLGLKFSTYLRIVLYHPKHKTIKMLKDHHSDVSTIMVSVVQVNLSSLGTGTYFGQLLWEGSQEENESNTKEKDEDKEDAGDVEGEEE